MITQLDLYILNNDNSVAPFPSEAEQIVLYDFAFEAQRMGVAPDITATIQANGSLENSLTTKVFCEYNDERYFLKNLPSSAKENTDPRYTFDLTFVSERTILDNVYMIDAVQGDSNIDRYQSNSTNIVFMGTIEECVARLNAAMTYAGVGYSVVLDEGITTESKLVSFQDKFFTEALQEIVNIHNIPYYYVGKVIHFGWSQTTIPTLKYGDGLLSINKSIRTERIVNRATATGSSENIPYYYPNPTPKGFITPIITDNSGAGISVINEARLGKLAEGSKLRYCEFESPLEIQGLYSSYSALSAGVEVAGTPILKEDGYILIQRQKLTFVYIKVSWSSPTDEVGDFLIQYKARIGNNETKVQRLGVYAYNVERRDSNIGVVDTAILDASISAELIGDHIAVSSLPSNQERYIGVVYKNDTTNYYGSVFHASATALLENGWYIHNGDVRLEDYPVNISKYGVVSNLTPAEGDEVSYSVIKKIPVATTLMPPIYRDSDGVNRFYNAINGAYEGITFENEYSAENPKEAITKFEDIKPTIVGVTNANGERIDMFAEFAYDLNDSDETEQTDESSENFIHPYFYAKLRRIDGDNGFNLFAQAIESGEMTIEMTSGHCGACKFVIAVDENTQRNLVMVDDNGNLIYDDATGKVKMADDATGLDRQNDTQNYEVWIALKKDINTFGTVMPMANSTIKPSVDDTFVITNILLPQAYFTAAEKKLEDEIIAFLAKNNTFQFEYGINFSRIFLKKRNDVFSKLTENSIIPIEYNGNKLSFYVSSYTYRKQKGEVLPEISVSLTDNFDSTPSAFQQSINAIQENIVRGIGAVGLTLEDTDPRYLRKDVADTVKERTTFEKGMDFGGTLTSKGFKKGNLIGAGFGVYTDENGNTVVEADRMVIRKDAQFSEIVINQTTFQLGATVFSGGGCNITDVEEVEGAYRCYYDNKSGTRFSGFVVGDQARCQRFDENQKEIIKYYWRVVVAVGDNYVDLSTTDVDGTGIPEVGDDIVHFGNRTDKSRQSAIVINPLNGGSVEVYAGINSFSLEDKNYVGMGVNPNTNEAYMYGYGDIYIGDRDINAEDATYVTYQKKDGDSKRKVHISADVNLGKNSTGLSNLSDFQSLACDVQDAQQSANEADRKAQSAQDYIDNELPKELENLQNQIDGKKEEYYYDYDPTLDNYPASEWVTEEDKESHLYDTFTNINTGQSWRWLYQDGAYQWVLQADTVANEALLKAQEALGVANGKRTIFVTEPYPPYQVGDLWVKGTAGRTMRCIIARDSGSFTASDWDYADDSHEYADEKIATVDYLKQAFPQDSILDVNGVTLSALVGVKDENNAVVAGLYGGASDVLNNAGYADAIHGAMLLFGGIEGVDKPKTYKTAIFEDGFLQSTYFATAKEGKRVEIFGNELKVYGDDASQSVLSISYDSTAKPRLQYTDKSGNVSWYLSDKGISTSYTVEQIDEFLKRYIRNDISEDINVIHKFVNGIKIGDILLTYDSVNEALCINGNMYALGGITAGGVGSGSTSGGGASYDRLDSWSDYSADKAGYVLSALLGKDLDNRVSALANAGYITASALAPYVLRSEVEGQYLSKNGGTVNGSVTLSIGNIVVSSGDTVVGKIYPRTDNEYTLGQDTRKWKNILCYNINGSTPVNASNLKSTLGISDWALASAKPTYTASEVGALGVNDTATNANKLGGYLPTTYMRASGQYTDSLNDLTSLGIYRMSGTITDGPTGAVGYGNLMVVRSNSWDTLSQLYFNANNNRIFVRSGTNSNFTSKDWSTFAYISDIPTRLSQLTDDVVAGKYLPLSGGTVTGEFIVNGQPIVTKAGNATITFSPNNREHNYWFGVDIYGSLFITDNGYTKVRAIIHEDNIGNYKAGDAGNSDKLGWVEASKYFKGDSTNLISNINADNLLNNACYLNQTGNGSGNENFPHSYSIFNVFTNGSDSRVAQVSISNDGLAIRRKIDSWGEWRHYINTANIGNYNAGSATKLQTPRTIWGQSFDGTGDITGPLHLGNNISIRCYSTSGSKISTLILDPSNTLLLGYDMSNIGGMVLYGKALAMRYGTSRTMGFLLNEYGNVAIGGATADEKLHVHGNGKFEGALTANSLTIGGATITYDSVNEALCINGNMYALGGVTAGGAGISAYSSLEARVARLEQQLNIE